MAVTPSGPVSSAIWMTGTTHAWVLARYQGNRNGTSNSKVTIAIGASSAIGSGAPKRAAVRRRMWRTATAKKREHDRLVAAQEQEAEQRDRPGQVAEADQHAGHPVEAAHVGDQAGQPAQHRGAAHRGRGLDRDKAGHHGEPGQRPDVPVGRGQKPHRARQRGQADEQDVAAAAGDASHEARHRAVGMVGRRRHLHGVRGRELRRAARHAGALAGARTFTRAAPALAALAHRYAPAPPDGTTMRSAPGSRRKVAGRMPGVSPSTSRRTGSPPTGSARTVRARRWLTLSSSRWVPL